MALAGNHGRNKLIVNKSRQIGFTIVELLIVIVIIGILAAIVIVAYNGITNSAKDSAVQSDLANMAKKLALEKVDNGTFPIPPTIDTGIHITKSAYFDSNNLYYCYDAATDRYVVQARSASNNVFKIVDGVVSSGASSYGYSGQGTCNTLEAGLTWDASGSDANASVGYNTATKVWAPWAQG